LHPRQPAAKSLSPQGERALRRYRFGAVEVRSEERVLLVDGKPAELGGRAFDVLLALIESRGRVVTKDELLAYAWPGLVVEENNLQQQISTLRKLLGQDAILTVPGRGYRFALEETEPGLRAASAPSSVAGAAPGAAWRSRRVLLTAAFSLLLLGAVIAWWGFNRPSNKPAAGPLSIAVLPFANLTGDPNQSYVADGLTAAITHDLSRIHDAFIVDASMAYTFKNKPVLAQQAGTQLGVHYVLVGSVQRSNERIRVHAQLDDTVSGAQLWSDDFDGDETDLFALEDRVTVRIVNSIGREMTVAAARESEKRKSDPKVADLLLRAWAMTLTGLSPKKLIAMEDLYRQALAIEPDNAVATIGLANLASYQAEVFGFALDAKTREAKFEEARTLALKARELDPDLPGIYVTLGTYAKFHDDFAGFRHAAETRLALEPKNPVSYLNLAETYLEAAEPKRVIELIDQANDLDPKNQRDLWKVFMAYAHFMQGDNDGAIHWSTVALDKNPKLPYAYGILALAYAQQGDQAKARAAVADLHRIAPGFTLALLNHPTASYPDSAKEFWNRKLLPAWRLAGLPE
jgi:TolB-like protein/DNA-binding winged helix-turn-helix (wHTH) protein/tetratricopeptide (TPR) repeat protein